MNDREMARAMYLLDCLADPTKAYAADPDACDASSNTFPQVHRCALDERHFGQPHYWPTWLDTPAGRPAYQCRPGTMICSLPEGHPGAHRHITTRLDAEEPAPARGPAYYAPELSDLAGALAQVSHFAYEGRHRLEESPLSGLLLALDNLDGMRADYERRSKDPRKDWLAVLGYLAERQAEHFKSYQPTETPLVDPIVAAIDRLTDAFHEKLNGVIDAIYSRS